MRGGCLTWWTGISPPTAPTSFGRYGIAFLGALAALPTDRFGFLFEQGFDQARSPILRALGPTRVASLEWASSRFPCVLFAADWPFRYPNNGLIIQLDGCDFHLPMEATKPTGISGGSHSSAPAPAKKRWRP
jgi:hypothetical protein